VFDLIFPNLDREKANRCKACENKKNGGEEKSEEEDKSD
jgi:Lon-like ATP-dependent protease